MTAENELYAGEWDAVLKTKNSSLSGNLGAERGAVPLGN